MWNVPRVVREDGCVASAKVERASVGVADEDGRLGLALVKVQPLLSLHNPVSQLLNSYWQTCRALKSTYVRVPVQLAQTARLERHKRRRNGLADGEVGRVDLVELAAVAANLLGLVLESAVDEGAVAASDGCAGRLGHVARADRRVDDVRVGRGDVVEDGLVDAEVLGEDGLGGVGDPVIDVECGAVDRRVSTSVART